MLSDACAPPAGYTLESLLDLTTPTCQQGPAASSRGAVIDAILLYDQDGLQQALSLAQSGVDRPDADGLTPLHYCVAQGWEEGLALLVLHGANIFARSGRCNRYQVGVAPVYKTGGGTALHACAETGDVRLARALLTAASPGAAQCLAAACDADGHTAARVALLHGHAAALFAVLEESGVPTEEPLWSDEERHTRRREWELKQRQRIDGDLREREEARGREHLQRMRQSYVPLHPQLYASDSSVALSLLDPRVVQTAQSQDPRTWGDLLTRLADDVYTLPWLSASGCTLLLEELQHVHDHLNAAVGAEVRRPPNSMNRAGLVLSDIGLDHIVSHWVHCVLAPLSMAMYEESAASAPFGSMHAFTIHYRQGEDTELHTHRDDSSLTLNVCMQADGVEGAALYFCEGECEGKLPPCAPTTNEREKVAIRYRHQVGHAVIHPGSVRHGSETLTAGVRSNVVVWCRQEN